MDTLKVDGQLNEAEQSPASNFESEDRSISSVTGHFDRIAVQFRSIYRAKTVSTLKLDGQLNETER